MDRLSRLDGGTTEIADSKRQHVRFAFTGKAELVVTGEGGAVQGTALQGTAAPGATLHGTMLDLSKRGCLLMLAEPYAIQTGAGVEVLFRLNDQSFRVSGAVKTQRSDNRIAIQFDYLDAGIGRQLATLPSTGSRGKGNRSEEPLTSGGPAKRNGNGSPAKKS